MKRLSPGLACVWLIGAVVVVLHLQGWAGRLTNADVVPHARDALALVRNGTLPVWGGLNSLASCNPPGNTWLLAPGAAWLADPRLVQVPGGALLFLAALAGVYRLARGFLPRPGACACAGVYALSAVGMGTATSLWPRFPQAAAIWTFVLLVEWARDRRAAALAGALLVWALGLYVHMEGLLLAPLFAALWVVYRPPVRSRRLVVVAALVAAVWWPYVRADAACGWTNLRSQLALRTLLYTPAAQPAVNAAAVRAGVAPLELPAPHSSRGLASRAIDALGAVEQKARAMVRMPAANLAAHLRSAWLAWTAGLLLLGACLCCGLAGWRLRFRAPPDISPRVRRVAAGLGILLCLAGLAGNEVVLARILGRSALESYAVQALHVVQGLLLAGGIAMGFGPWLAARLRDLLARPAGPAAVPAFGLLVAWGTAMAIADPDAPYRVHYLWPMQVAMGGWVVYALVRRVASPLLRPVLAAACVVAGFLTSPAPAAMADWACRGWKGGSAEVDTLDALGCRVAADRGPASIEYRCDCPAWIVYYGALDDRYHAGMEFDWYLQCRYGITNVPAATPGARRWRLVDREAASPVRAGQVGLETRWCDMVCTPRFTVQIAEPAPATGP